MLHHRSAAFPAVLTLWCVALVGCGESGPGSTGEFDITYPPDWEAPAVSVPEMVRSMRSSPADSPDDRFRENVNVVVESLPHSMSVEEYQSAMEPMMKMSLVDFKRIDRKSVTLGGVHARRDVYEHSMNGNKLKVLAYTLTSGKYGYVITCTAMPGTYDSFEPKFEAICATFTLK